MGEQWHRVGVLPNPGAELYGMTVCLWLLQMGADNRAGLKQPTAGLGTQGRRGSFISPSATAH